MTLRYGIIGSGMMGCEHIRNIALLPDGVVSAIADPDAGMQQASVDQALKVGMAKPAVYHDYKDLLSANIADVLVIASPNDTHFAIMDDVLATNCPVLLEKPIATDVEEAFALAARAQGRAAPVWVAMEYRYMPPIARLINRAQDGTIGSGKMLSIVEHRFPFLHKVGDWNRFNKRTGGTLVEKCCHFFDLMRLVTASEPVKIYASGGQDVNHLDETYDGQTPDILDNAFVIVDFANGMRASLDLCMFAEGTWWQEHVSVVGDRGKVEAFVPGPSRFWPGGEERTSQIVVSPRADKAPVREELHVDEKILAAGDHHGSTFFQHEKFQNIVRHGGKPEVSLHDGAMAVEMGAAAQQSIVTGQAINLKPR